MKRTYLVGIAVIVIAIVAVVAVYLAVTPTPSPPMKKLKVAMIMGASIKDYGWGTFAYNALMDLAKENPDIEVAYSEGLNDNPAAAKAGRDYASKGFDIVYFHGGQFPVVVEEICKDFPNTTFGAVGGYGYTEENIKKMPKNVFWYRSWPHELYYLTGVVAGKMTKTNKVAIVGGLKVASLMQGVQAFYEGLKAVNPSADFRFAFTGTMEDPTKAKEAALALINEGVDIIFNMQNYGVFGLIDAVKSYDNVYLIGWYLDQWDLAPGKFIVSGIFDFKTAFFNIIKLYREGKLGGTIYDTTIWTGTYHLSDDHGMIPADVKAIVNDYWNRLWENKIVLSRQAWTG